MAERILDASNVNPASAEQVRASKAVALIWKATQGSYFTDKTIAAGRKIAATLRIPFGSYVFQDPRDTPAGQHSRYLAAAKPRPGDLEPIIDSETTAGKTWAEIAGNVDALARLFEAGGYRPLLYGSTSWLLRLYEAQPRLRRLRVWQAQYPRIIPPVLKKLLGQRTRLGKGATVVAWQYTTRWKILGRGFDGSYLLAPLDSILIPHPKAAKAAGGRRVPAKA